jgi:hypothetical protein
LVDHLEPKTEREKDRKKVVRRATQSVDHSGNSKVEPWVDWKDSPSVERKGKPRVDSKEQKLVGSMVVHWGERREKQLADN